VLHRLVEPTLENGQITDIGVRQPRAIARHGGFTPAIRRLVENRQSDLLAFLTFDGQLTETLSEVNHYTAALHAWEGCVTNVNPETKER
jgi:hypothetical protein